MSSFPWNRIAERAARMTTAELEWSIKDCVEARNAMQNHNQAKSDYYADEASVYRTELNRRQLPLARR